MDLFFDYVASALKKYGYWLELTHIGKPNNWFVIKSKVSKEKLTSHWWVHRDEAFLRIETYNGCHQEILYIGDPNFEELLYQKIRVAPDDNPYQYKHLLDSTRPYHVKIL